MVRFVIDQGKNEQMAEKNMLIALLLSRVNLSHRGSLCSIERYCV